MACCSPPPASHSASTTEVVATAKVHVHLHVADLAAATVFYRSLCGADPVKQHPGYAKFLPSWAPLNLALSQRDETVRGSTVSHLGIQVGSPQQVQQQLQRIQALGLNVRVEMGVDCCHANQDKFWVVDPAGIEWEIYYLNYDLAEPVGPSCATHATRSCCPA